MPRILCIGECMVELAPQGDPGLFRMGFAGDTMNTAWYLRQLLPQADTVDYLTAVGSDAVSDQLVAHLQDAGLGTDHVARRADRTVGLYMIQLQDGERSFAYWRGQSAARTLAAEDAPLEAALEGAGLVYLSGITLAILPPPDRDRLLRHLARVRSSGTRIAFDSNLRPRLWETPAVMTDAVMRAAAVSDIVLPSHDDEATWFGDADPAATAERYARAGASEVVVKNGSGPIRSLCDGTATDHAPVPVPRVVDSTAAGDSFNAGFLAGRLQGADVAQAVHLGARLSAQVIQTRGALLALSDADRAALVPPAGPEGLDHSPAK